MIKKTTIQVTKEFRDYLGSQTISKKESYEDIIKRLLGLTNSTHKTK